MKKLIIIFLATISIAGCSTQQKAEPGSTNLIDDSLSHFENIYDYGDARVENGELILRSTGNWFLTTKKRYQDFILTAEVIMPDVNEYSNSGIMFRGQVKTTGDKREAMGYQAEVDPSDRKWSGGLYDQARRQWLHPVHATRSEPDEDFKESYLPGWTDEMANAYRHLEWNKYRIECRGSDIKIYVNGVLTTHVRDTKDSEGFIGLQHHGSQLLKETGRTNNIVRFRNVTITELE
ncbi:MULTISPECIES: 3-keto-disaccharide hydrolase [unclassified Marinimicrobium]|uniref:3-keto-disaccharide hydrolase n=1 Tax=unclassified Marinimicrobium TaxID=2632100 RepID=UPI00257CAF5C|nr:MULTISPECIES: DUF1080 domain-containing protein [unclassified Marinimicrobium]